MNLNDAMKKMREGLIDSYKHRIANDCSCAICGNKVRPLAFHVLEASYEENQDIPNGFVAMSASGGIIRGCFPVCDSCAPVCDSCHLPIATEKVLEFGHSIDARIGIGHCKDIKLGLLLLSLYKRIFKKGRFRGKSTL